MLLYENTVTLFMYCLHHATNLTCRPESAAGIVFAIFRCIAVLSERLSLLLSPLLSPSLSLMTLPEVDPDPTTQIPWPGARKRSDPDPDDSRVSQPPANPTNNSPRRPSVGSKADANGKRRRLSTLDLVYLSISMAGAQIAWTVELG
jgi:hypothetical protein